VCRNAYSRRERERYPTSRTTLAHLMFGVILQRGEGQGAQLVNILARGEKEWIPHAYLKGVVVRKDGYA
jgi:hypothetical protein